MKENGDLEEHIFEFDKIRELKASGAKSEDEDASSQLLLSRSTLMDGVTTSGIVGTKNEQKMENGKN